jgi:adenylate cyclase
VNLASRLEALNKEYGTGILVSADTQQSAGAAFTYRKVGDVTVRGRKGATGVFELVGAAEA